MTEKEVRKIFKEELDTFLKKFEQISEKLTEDVSKDIENSTDEKFSKIEKLGLKKSKANFELEIERRKALKDAIWCLEEMKKLTYHLSKHKEKYNELVVQSHEALKRHDSVLRELTD
ncbi:MAG: hypothetical protein HUJ87_01010 [Fusobacterium varium]|uniref:hypothetical protein n=1 Tax=Fusobacterium varium TaxID=856 RepID=UPI0024302D8A|nr:hypothetical protein [Fusobacterium varium]MCF0169051.1 hypothetical protein [Fusobacterium varium]